MGRLWKGSTSSAGPVCTTVRKSAPTPSASPGLSFHEWSLELDRRVFRALGLSPGVRLSAREAWRLLVEKVPCFNFLVPERASPEAEEEYLKGMAFMRRLLGF